MYFSFLQKMGVSQTGHPWRNPEDKLLRDPLDPEFIPPPVRSPAVPSPLVHPQYPASLDPAGHVPPRQDSFTPPSTLYGASRDSRQMQAKMRAIDMDCITSTLEFIQVPVLVALGFGAMQAAVHAKPPSIALRDRLRMTKWQVLKGSLMREAKYLTRPVAIAGGFSATYSIASCVAAKYSGEDGIKNSVFAGFVTGLLGGLFLRDPNKVFLLSTYGAAAAGLAKYYYLDPRTARAPRLTYYEKVDARKQMMGQEVRERAKDGYIHEWLQPGLKKEGITVPASWPQP